MNRNRLLFIQVQTLPLSMHHKWKEIIDSVFKTTSGYSLGTKSQRIQGKMYYYVVLYLPTQTSLVVVAYSPDDLFVSPLPSRLSIVAEKFFIPHNMDVLKKCKLLAQGKTLHVAAGRSEDHCMVYAELSRLFFSGESNQQFANFLHLITMMASLGSSKDDVESYIVNTQGIKPLPVGMVPWKIKTGGSETNLHHQTTTSLPSEKAPSLAEVYLERHAKLEESLPRKARTTQPVYSGWPPRSWVPIPTVQSTAMSSVKIEHCSGPSVDGIKEDQAPGPSKQNGVNKVDALNAVHSWQGDFSSHTNTSGAGTANGGMIRGNLRDSMSETAIFSPIGAESMTVANTHDRPVSGFNYHSPA